ncbi:immediate early response gene 2 protein [Plectropomus leopardus]|uniref:immediate early response gene 2 protein n=1 Tax=Plectropomus leopardus TaxID=160734 RepID=UPI001C4DB166|nr:immediate early response gene 2 protein [Plectropomus leopardus]
MEVSAEAKRIMVVALGKLYSSRTQRGGLRLHRSLLLTLVMKSARDMYHAAQATAESVASGCELNSTAEAGQIELQSPAPLENPRTSPVVEVAASSSSSSSSSELRRDEAQNKENLSAGAAQHSRKRRGKAAAEPDFLPCKKAKLEQLIVSSVLLDYVTCSSELGAPPAPLPLHRAIAAC